MRLGNPNVFPLAYRASDLGDQWGVKLYHLPATPTREMVMRLFLHRFVVTVAFAKSMLLNQP
jgi:hypothetical protein